MNNDHGGNWGIFGVNWVERVTCNSLVIMAISKVLSLFLKMSEFIICRSVARLRKLGGPANFSY